MQQLEGRKWQYNIKTNLNEIAREAVIWICFAWKDQLRVVVKTVRSFWIPRNEGDFLTSHTSISFSGRNVVDGVAQLHFIRLCK
jgi:hypothetical protein